MCKGYRQREDEETCKEKRNTRQFFSEFCQTRQTRHCSAPSPLSEPQRSRYGYCNLNLVAALHRINEPVFHPALQGSWRPWCRLSVTDVEKINWRIVAEQKRASRNMNEKFPCRVGPSIDQVFTTGSKVVCTRESVLRRACERVSDLGSPEGGDRHTNPSCSTPCALVAPSVFYPTSESRFSCICALFISLPPAHQLDQGSCHGCAARQVDANSSPTLYCFPKRPMAPQHA